MATYLNDTDALLVVDVQNDFLPGGSLAVPGGDQVIPVLNRYIALFERRGLPILATRDWHPARHCSFREQGGIWPVHCVAGSSGATFPVTLALPQSATIISKATSEQADAYSGFEGTNLADRLHSNNVERLFIGGLATDYCVLNTVTDALASGFKAVLLVDAIRAVNRQPRDGETAIAEMIERGAQALQLSELDAAANPTALRPPPGGRQRNPPSSMRH